MRGPHIAARYFLHDGLVDRTSFVKFVYRTERSQHARAVGYDVSCRALRRFLSTVGRLVKISFVFFRQRRLNKKFRRWMRGSWIFFGGGAQRSVAALLSRLYVMCLWRACIVAKRLDRSRWNLAWRLGEAAVTLDRPRQGAYRGWFHQLKVLHAYISKTVRDTMLDLT